MKTHRKHRIFFTVLAAIACGMAQAQTTIPASERAVLDAFYRQTGGPNWIINLGWEGAPGTECDWFGVLCDTNFTHVTGIVAVGGATDQNVIGNNLVGSLPSLSGLPFLVYFSAPGNYLTGPVPSLAGLSQLQIFNVGDNQLSGTIPSLAGLSSLQFFVAGGNRLTGNIPSLTGLSSLQVLSVGLNSLTGSIPALTGLSQLQLFDVSKNQLTGAIPSLAGLTNLTVFAVAENRLSGNGPNLTGLAVQNLVLGGNGLSGEPPVATTSLLAGGSSLCNNAFNHTANAAWDTATGYTPWYSVCTEVASTLSLSATDMAVATGTRTTLTAKLIAGKALIADPGSSNGTVTITNDQGKSVCYIRIDGTGTGSCDVLLPGGTTTTLTGGYSGTPNIAPASAQFSKTTPLTVSGNLDQHGWTGTWYNPATSGQGIVFEVYPDIGGIGTGLFGGGWFTFDTASGGEDKKRWYTLTGPVTSSSATTTLDIISPTGGNFNSAPVINSGDGADNVGHATIAFTDCTHGYLSYSFTDGSGRVGNIPLSRLDSNVTCDPTNGAGNGTAPGKFLLSGAWYTPSTSGQGVLFDINPVQNITFAAWYTYAPNGQSIGGGASQRWYTLQIASANVGASTLDNIGIYSAQGGLFDAPGNVTTPQVGAASIAFTNCNALVLNYNFSAGSNAGQSGSINLQRAGPTPAGCSL